EPVSRSRKFCMWITLSDGRPARAYRRNLGKWRLRGARSHEEDPIQRRTDGEDPASRRTRLRWISNLMQIARTRFGAYWSARSESRKRFDKALIVSSRWMALLYVQLTTADSLEPRQSIIRS